MNDQAQSLRKRMEARGRQQTKVIAVLSGKGGVGKSVFSVNFALALTRFGKKPLLIDLDIDMGNVDILLGVHAQYTIVDMIENRLNIEDIIVKDGSGAAFITGGSGLSHFVQMTESKIDYFLNQLAHLKQNYDVILFDLGAGVNESLMNFVQSSHEVLLVTTPEPTALTDAYSVVKTLDRYQHDMNICCVINRSDSEKEAMEAWRKLSGVSRKFLEKELQWLGSLPRDRAVTTAVQSQTPFITGQPRAKITGGLIQLVDRYLNHRSTQSSVSYDSFINKLKKVFRLKKE